LFLKIFLWFLVVVFTVIAGTWLVAELMRPHTPEQSRRPLQPVLAVQAQTAGELYERGGASALLAQLDRIQREIHIRPFFFDDQNRELSGRRVPDQAHELAGNVRRANAPLSFEHGATQLMGAPATTLSGKNYVLVAELAPRPPPPDVFHPIFHMLGVAGVGALFCYWLARHLTSPVSKLQRATRELAAGNLDVRVGPAMGNRRDELATLGADFDLMAEKIETLINSQRRLLGDISHELRSPLARLNVALELARQRSGSEATSALERIQREAENLNDLIGQLLALTRLESGAVSVVKNQFDLTQLVREVGEDADFEARGRDRTVRVTTIDSHLMDGNYELIRRAIENVVRNAVHYTAKGTAVEVVLSEKEGETDGAVIKVRDHGPGVPDEALEKIFQPFYRVDEARDRESGGSGLGLAIAQRALKLHGGSIGATNADDGGLIVTMHLPAS
jgi:signal transduction histidine kinase